MNLYKVHAAIGVMGATLLMVGCGAHSGDSVGTSSEKSPVISTDAVFDANYADIPTLMKHSDRVFTGRVVDEIGPASWPGSSLPGMLYRVEIERTYGARLPAEVVVYQEGGWSEEAEAVILMENDALLIPGQTYLLAGKVGGPNDSIALIPGYGTLESDSPSLAEVAKAARATAQEHQ